MSLSNFSRMIHVIAVLGEECPGCGHIFSKEDVRKRLPAYKTTAGHTFCAGCYASDFDMEAYVGLITNGLHRLGHHSVVGGTV